MTVHRGSVILALINAGLMSVPTPRRVRPVPSRAPRRRTPPRAPRRTSPIGVTSILHHDKTNTNANQNHVDLTMPATTAGTLIMVGLGNANNHTSTGVTNGGDTFVQAAASVSTNATGAFNSDIWYCLAGAGGKTAFVGTFSGTSTTNKDMWIIEVSYTGTATFDVASGTTNAVGATNIVTGAAITATGSTGFAFSVVVTQGSITGISSGGFTIGDVTASGDGSATQILGGAGSTTAIYSDANAGPQFACSTAAVKFSGGGGGGTSWGPQLSDQLNRIVQYAA